MAPSETQRYVPAHATTTNSQPPDLSHSRSLSEPTPGAPTWSHSLSSRPKSWECADLMQKDWRRGPEDLPATAPADQNSASPSSKLDKEWRRGNLASLSPQIWSVGQVVQLPPESKVPATSPALLEVGGNPWDHPAVITALWESNGTKFAKVQNCTSLGGRCLEEARRECDWKYFLEVTPDRLVKGSGNFAKRTYVNCSPTKGTEFTIEYDLLFPYNGKDWGSSVKFNDGAMAELASIRHLIHYDGADQP